MDYKSLFNKISSFLKQHDAMINNEVIFDHLNYKSYYPKSWLAELKNLPSSDQHLFECGQSLAFKDTELNTFLDQIKELSYFEMSKIHSRTELDTKAAWKIKEKKHHELTRTSSFLKDRKDNLGQKITDIAGGVGHLARTLATELELPVQTIDFDKDLHKLGKSRLHKYPLPKQAKSVSFVTDSFNCPNSSSELVKKTFAQRQFSVGLHTCGPLSLNHFHHAIDSNTLGLLNFGCCYLRLDPDKHTNISTHAKEHGLYIGKYALTLATRGNNHCSFKEFELKKRVKMFRYLLHLFCDLELKILPPRKIGPSHKREYWGSFSDFIYNKLTGHKLPSKQVICDFFHNKAIQDEFETMFSANLIRWRLGRLVELYLNLDRVLYLEENGFKAELHQVFDEAISPRNFGIFALNKN